MPASPVLTALALLQAPPHPPLRCMVLLAVLVGAGAICWGHGAALALRLPACMAQEVG